MNVCEYEWEQLKMGKMKYEEPKFMVSLIECADVVRTSDPGDNVTPSPFGDSGVDGPTA